jgi:hypothetical protein
LNQNCKQTFVRVLIATLNEAFVRGWIEESSLASSRRISACMHHVCPITSTPVQPYCEYELSRPVPVGHHLVINQVYWFRLASKRCELYRNAGSRTDSHRLEVIQGGGSPFMVTRLEPMRESHGCIDRGSYHGFCLQGCYSGACGGVAIARK